MNATKVRYLSAVGIFLTAQIGLLLSANLIREMLTAYPASHLASYGPRVPEVARLYAGSLPYAPACLLAACVASVAFCIFHRRSAASQESKAFAMAAVAALGLFLAFFCATVLLLAYFYLPKIANAA